MYTTLRTTVIVQRMIILNKKSIFILRKISTIKSSAQHSTQCQQYMSFLIIGRTIQTLGHCAQT